MALKEEKTNYLIEQWFFTFGSNTSRRHFLIIIDQYFRIVEHRLDYFSTIFLLRSENNWMRDSIFN